MKRFLLALALLLVPAAASAQCNGVFPNNTVCGNVTGSNNTPRATSLAAFLGAAGGTNGQIQYNNSGALGGFGPITGDIALTVPGAVSTIQPNSVITSKINNAAVTAGKLAGNALPTYASRADASAVDLSGFSTIQTLGYTVGGDGGQAIYNKVASQPFCGAFTDTSAFQDLAGNWWQRSSVTGYNVLQYGAKGDWNGVDSGTTNNSAAFQSAGWCAGVQTGPGPDVGGGGGRRVHVPNGSYKLVTKIIIPDGVFFEGEGVDATVFVMATAFSASSHFIILGNQFTATDVFALQSIGSGGTPFTLNGTFARSGVVYYLAPAVPCVYAAAVNSGINFTFTGTDRYGAAQSDTFAGPGAGSSTCSSKFWSTITRVETNGATNGNVSVGEAQTASFDSGLRDVQLYSTNDNATQFVTPINNTCCTGVSGNAMVYSNSTQHTGGLDRVKIFAGNRSAAIFEFGIGGASTVTIKHLETFNHGNCGGCASNNPQLYFNWGGLLLDIDHLVIGGPGVATAGSISLGIQLTGGYLNLRNWHVEGIATGLRNSLASINAGSLTVMNANGAANMTSVIRIDAGVAANSTNVQGIFPNGSTHTVDNNGSFNNTNITQWTSF